MTSRKIVLVVEDDLLLRIITADLVEEAGFEALEAANAEEAVAILEVRDDVRVVLTDVDMPGSMDGAKLAAAIRDRWPPVEMIVISGKRIKSEIILPERVMFFSKPYDVDELIAELHRLAVLKSVHPLNHSAAAPIAVLETRAGTLWD